MRVLVTGGSGFIGSAVVRWILGETTAEVVNVDKLTYAASAESLAAVRGDARYRFEQADVADAGAMRHIFEAHQPDRVMHLAAETHVDRSIDAPAEFIQTNLVGSYVLLQESLRYFQTLSAERQREFRYHHVSTDEVYGALELDAAPVDEEAPYRPNSPYSASKAGADHLSRAWHRTYGLPVVISNCSNNYGPFQFPEKLIPLTIIKALSGEPIPVYGDGKHVRDWLYVEDHARALWEILSRGRIGETYLVGGHGERHNLDIVEMICDRLDAMAPTDRPRRAQIQLVPDRPGHDRRYAIDASKLENELGFAAREQLETGLEKTVRWYLDHRSWWERIRAERYRGERLGLAERRREIME